MNDPVLVLRYGVGTARRLVVATCLRRGEGDEEILSIATDEAVDREPTDDVTTLVVGPVNFGPRSPKVGAGEVLVSVAQRGRG